MRSLQRLDLISAGCPLHLLTQPLPPGALGGPQTLVGGLGGSKVGAEGPPLPASRGAPAGGEGDHRLLLPRDHEEGAPRPYWTPPFHMLFPALDCLTIPSPISLPLPCPGETGPPCVPPSTCIAHRALTAPPWAQQGRAGLQCWYPRHRGSPRPGALPRFEVSAHLCETRSIARPCRSQPLPGGPPGTALPAKALVPSRGLPVGTGLPTPSRGLTLSLVAGQVGLLCGRRAAQPAQRQLQLRDVHAGRQLPISVPNLWPSGAGSVAGRLAGSGSPRRPGRTCPRGGGLSLGGGLAHPGHVPHAAGGWGPSSQALCPWDPPPRAPSMGLACSARLHPRVPARLQAPPGSCSDRGSRENLGAEGVQRQEQTRGRRASAGAPGSVLRGIGRPGGGLCAQALPRPELSCSLHLPPGTCGPHLPPDTELWWVRAGAGGVREGGGVALL